MVKLVIFAVVSLGIISLSWTSLHSCRSHGFFRFFAFETILASILLNVTRWFTDPFSALQVVSWVLLSSSLFLAAHGFYLLRMVGRPEGRIENTTTVVTAGAYRLIRHPLYASLLLLEWGVFFKGPSLLVGILALATSLLLLATAKAEERENVERFGAEYERYMNTTTMFVPFLF